MYKNKKAFVEVYDFVVIFFHKTKLTGARCTSYENKSSKGCIIYFNSLYKRATYT